MPEYNLLTPQVFGTLQSRLTPTFYAIQTGLTSALLLTHLYFHPGLISSPRVPPHWVSSEEGHQGLFILGALVPSIINWAIVGPLSVSSMFEKHRLERVEGKSAKDPNVSGGRGFVGVLAR